MAKRHKEESLRDLIADIGASDRLVGYATLQMNDCAENEIWFPALASLFLLTEQVLRWAADADDRSRLPQVIERALNARIIAQRDAEALNAMREYRNSYMHSNFHGIPFQIGGLYYWASEAETAQALYEMLSRPCLGIIRKLVSKNYAYNRGVPEID
jgi:hypothetical protein